MDKSVVALLQCNSYDENQVYEKVKEGIRLVGGLESIIGKNEKVLVKPNLLVGADPIKAVTTHPSVLSGVLRCLSEEGYSDISYGDSNSKPISDIEKEMMVAGLDKPAKKFGVKLSDFSSSVNVAFKEGKFAKKFVLAKGAYEADAIISVCKMKTHALERITGAVKNQYGCIYATNKAIGHAHYPSDDSFAKMLVDLNLYLKPRLYVMDGVMAMEGNGPASGNPTMMNVILVSKDPVALDSVFASLINLDPQTVPTCKFGEEMGLGHYKQKDIQILTSEGEISFALAYQKYGKPGFDVNREKKSFWVFRALFGRKKITHKPVVNLDLCIGCGVCENVCPVDGKAVHSGKGSKAQYDYSKCIRCYCCQEMCPEKAITRKEK